MQTSQYHVFSLPPDILNNLVSRDRLIPKRSRSPSPAAVVAASQVPSTGGSRACNVCLAATFNDVEEQRAHFRSDWHRYNVKVRFNGGSPVTEAHFAELVDELEDSLSGSASSEDDDSDDPDAVAALVRKAKITAREPSPTSDPNPLPRTPLAWFHSSPSTQIGVYKMLFARQIEPKSYLPELHSLQEVKERKWALFMTAGGHFAGAIVRVSRGEEEDGVETGKKKPKRPKPDTEVLRHKTFHRYTTRRKQGGSQSMNDNAKGNAKSAGAQLRRYGEQALRDDIRQLLHDWSDDIGECERIWIRASSSNKRIFLESDDAVIEKGDERLRTFPFPTRRPTQSELFRCLLELTRVKISHFTEDALRAQDEAYLASLPKQKPKPTVTPSASEDVKIKIPKLTKEEEELREKWERLLEMIKKGRLDSFITFWAREGSDLGDIDAPIPDYVGEHWGTLLQVATAAGHENVITWLLEDAHADPTISARPRIAGEEDHEDTGQRSDPPSVQTMGSRRTAYDLAKTRGVRNIFRRCAALHPDWWDWFGAGHVPSALDQKTEEQQEDKKKVRRKMLKERVRDREAKEREKEQEKEKESPSPVAHVEEGVAPVRDDHRPRKLGGPVVGANEIAGLTPEMRMRIERERRARAAEARIQSRTGIS